MPISKNYKWGGVDPKYDPVPEPGLVRAGVLIDGVIHWLDTGETEPANLKKLPCVGDWKDRLYDCQASQ